MILRIKSYSEVGHHCPTGSHGSTTIAWTSLSSNAVCYMYTGAITVGVGQQLGISGGICHTLNAYVLVPFWNIRLWAHLWMEFCESQVVWDLNVFNYNFLMSAIVSLKILSLRPFIGRMTWSIYPVQALQTICIIKYTNKLNVLNLHNESDFEERNM